GTWGGGGRGGRQQRKYGRGGGGGGGGPRPPHARPPQHLAHRAHRAGAYGDHRPRGPGAGRRAAAPARRDCAAGVSAPHAHTSLPLALALLLLGIAGQVSAGQSAATYYTLADFARVEKIDAHVHVHGTGERFMAQAEADGFRVLSIDVDYPDYPSLPEQLRDSLALRARYPGRVAFVTAFSVADFHSPGWSERVVRDIDAAVAQGAVGVKIW